MGVVGINPVQRQGKRDVLDRIVQGLMIAKSIGDIAVNVPEFMEKMSKHKTTERQAKGIYTSAELREADYVKSPMVAATRKTAFSPYIEGLPEPEAFKAMMPFQQEDRPLQAMAQQKEATPVIVEMEDSRVIAKQDEALGLPPETALTEENFSALKKRFPGLGDIKIKLLGEKGEIKEHAVVKGKDIKDLMAVEMKLSGDWESNDTTQRTRILVDAYERFLSAAKSATGRSSDMALITNYVKMTNPQARISADGSIEGIEPGSLPKNIFDKVKSVMFGTSQLQGSERAELQRNAEALLNGQLKAQGAFDAAMRGQAEGYGVSPDMVVKEDLAQGLEARRAGRREGKNELRNKVMGKTQQERNQMFLELLKKKGIDGR